MNPLDTLGLSAQGGLMAAAAGLLIAFALAWGVFFRRSRAESRAGFRLDDR
jgi:hypothetical protein